MIENIVMYLENGMTALMVISVYLYLLVSLYPRLTMRTVWKADRQSKPSGDRGVRKLTFPGGRAVIYEPALKVRKYLRQYALIKQDGCTYIKCRIHERIAYIRYDVATFDRKGRLLDVLNVNERITEGGYTRTVRLPRATAYACVTLRKVDGMYENREATVGYSIVGITVYTALAVVTAMILGSVLHECIAEVMETLPLKGQVTGRGITVLVAAVLGGLSAGWVVFMHHVHAKKVINK